MCRVFDRDPSDGAPARATRNQGPGKLRGEAIGGASFKSMGRVGRQALQELEERDGLVAHRSAVGHILRNFDCPSCGVCQEFGCGNLSFRATKFDQQDRSLPSHPPIA